MNRLAVVAVIGVPTIAGVAISAGPSGAATAVRAVVVRHASPGAIPNATIKGNGKKAKFNPKELSVAEDTSGDGCTTGFESLTLTNKGKKTYYVTFDGSPFFTQPKKSVEEICFYGGSPGAMGTIGLSNSTNTVTYKGTLTITLSN
jgi:hypothetical protein